MTKQIVNNKVFLEIKRKYEIPIIKFRAPVHYDEALECSRINHKWTENY